MRAESPTMNNEMALADLAAKRARDERNNRGADAWSPSRAREALRAHFAPRLIESTCYPGWLPALAQERLLAAEGHIHDPELFDAYCDRVIGKTLAV